MSRQAEPRPHAELARALAPVLTEARDRATVADRFVDKNLFQLSLATLWANLVMSPSDLGFTEPELEPVYTLLSDAAAQVLGPDEDLRSCFAFINGKAGERAMAEARLNQPHRDMLLYFASMMLDPEGHRRWMDELRSEL